MCQELANAEPGRRFLEPHKASDRSMTHRTGKGRSAAEQAIRALSQEFRE
jgi:hypothetical protein